MKLYPNVNFFLRMYLYFDTIISLKIEIRFFQTARGDEPVREYIKKLSEKERAKVEGCIYILATTGRLDMPQGRKMVGQKDLFEIRSGRHRILYTFYGEEIVLLNAFMKKSQETPKRELELAVRRLINYVSLGG